MSTLLNKNDTWNKDIQISSQESLITFQTANQYVDRDIAVNIQIADANLVAGNIKEDVTILGVTGTLKEDNPNNYKLQSKSVTPTKLVQSITPDSENYGLSTVTIEAIPAAYQDVTQVTATESSVLAGSKFVNTSGTVIDGTMKNNGAISQTINGLTTTSVTISAGYTSGGSVSLTDDIENALAAI